MRRNLILQHYGAPTPFVDVTHDIRVAEWFALNQISVQESGLSTSGMVASPFRASAIFVFLALDGLAPIVDTERLTTPEESLRPHRQACAGLGGAGNLYRNAVSRFIGLKIKFADSFRPSDLPTIANYSGPDEDVCSSGSSISTRPRPTPLDSSRFTGSLSEKPLRHPAHAVSRSLQLKSELIAQAVPALLLDSLATLTWAIRYLTHQWNNFQ